MRLEVLGAGHCTSSDCFQLPARRAWPHAAWLSTTTPGRAPPPPAPSRRSPAPHSPHGPMSPPPASTRHPALQGLDSKESLQGAAEVGRWARRPPPLAESKKSPVPCAVREIASASASLQPKAPCRKWGVAKPRLGFRLPSQICGCASSHWPAWPLGSSSGARGGQEGGASGGGPWLRWPPPVGPPRSASNSNRARAPR